MMSISLLSPDIQKHGAPGRGEEETEEEEEEEEAEEDSSSSSESEGSEEEEEGAGRGRHGQSGARQAQLVRGPSGSPRPPRMGLRCSPAFSVHFLSCRALGPGLWHCQAAPHAQPSQDSSPLHSQILSHSLPALPGGAGSVGR